MTSDDDFIGQLEAYLERFDGATPLPDRVRDAVHADLPWTRQVRPRSGLLRRINMSSTTSMIARWGLLAACLVVAVALGSAILLPGRGAGPGAATSPSPMPTVVLTPSPGASPLALAGAPAAACSSAQPSVETCIRAGTYLLAPTVPRGLVDVPVGWFEWEPGPGSVGLLVDRPDVGDGSGWGVVFMQVGDVARDPCDPSAGTYAATAVDTPAKLAGVMSAWPGFDGTPPETISIGGLTGIRTRLTSTNGASTCPGAWIWRTSAGVTVDGYPMIVGGSGGGEGYPADFRLVEVDGHLVAIRTMASASTSPNERAQGIADDPKRHEADLVTLQGILDSIRFEGAGS